MPNARFDFEHVLEAVQMVEDAVEAKKKKAAADNLERVTKAGADPFHSFIENPVFGPMIVDLWDAKAVFPLILRRSLLLTICSHVEFILKEWAVGLEREWTLEPVFEKFDKKRDNGGKLSVPEKALFYLRDVAQLDLGDFQRWPEWKKLDAYWSTRNAITHASGIVRETDRAKIERELPNILGIDESGIFGTTDPVIEVYPGACEDAATTAHNFFERIAQAYQANTQTS